MGGILYPYQPIPGSGSGLIVTGASQTVAVKKDARQVCVSNPGTVAIYARITPPGDTTPQPATVADQIVLPGQSPVFTKDGDCTQIQIFSATAGSAHVTSGLGF